MHREIGSISVAGRNSVLLFEHMLALGETYPEQRYITLASLTARSLRDAILAPDPTLRTIASSQMAVQPLTARFDGKQISAVECWLRRVELALEPPVDQIILDPRLTAAYMRTFGALCRIPS